ncbi:MAG: hypothetical protein O2909_04920 [Chloroflexi bacterium]|nr:hypothetical protein [Chloroflexota bacterium]MDA1218766.1 hypothetical protein [Chloroflexota bacterium]
MNLSFDKGDPARPKGHALIYFKVNTEPDKVYATYVVSLPVKADLSKYVPPFLANHLGSAPLSDFSSFAMPPVPEPVDSYQLLERLSQLRDDDLVYGDSMFSFDLPRMMEAVTKAVQEYSRMCDEFFDSASRVATPLAEARAGAGEVVEAEDTSFQVNEVLFSFMSENDKLTELSRLLGKLRFAQEGRDSSMANEASGEITSLARYLPAEFQMTGLLAAAQDASLRGSKLAQLYLDRCFRLSAGDSSSAQNLEEEIQSLEGQG